MTNAQGALAATCLSHKHFPWDKLFTPQTLLKPHFYSPRSPWVIRTYMISQCWEGPLCSGTSPASQSYLFPNFLAEAGTCRPGPHNHECPPHLDLSCPQKRPKSDGQHGIHVTTSPESGLSSRKYLDSHFSVRPKFRPIAAAGGAWTEQCPRPRQ